MRRMNEIMSNVTNENIDLSRKRSIIYTCLCALVLFGFWVPAFTVGVIFPQLFGIMSIFSVVLLIVGFICTATLALNYSSTTDSLISRKQSNESHNYRMAQLKKDHENIMKSYR